MRLAWSSPDDASGLLVITGWTAAELRAMADLDSAGLARRFAVVPADALARPTAATPMTGSFRLSGEALHFQPRHRFAAGVTYGFLTLDPDGDLAVACLTPLITWPVRTAAPSAEVTQVYPSSPTIPLNILRFYLHFSAPMSDGYAASAVAILDAHTGTELTDAFLPMQPELWDPTRSRLTLLLDPGRIKRGLTPHSEAGNPLAVARSVELVVDSRFQDAAGSPLRREHRCRYRIGPAVRSRLEPESWAIRVPRPGTRDPVRMLADRPLDHALAERCMTVVDDTGRRVPGRSILEDGDRDWTFAPDSAWTAPPRALLVDPMLEDVAGNSPTRVFDRDLEHPEDDPAPARQIAIDLGDRVVRTPTSGVARHPSGRP